MWDEKITGGLALGMASPAYRPWNKLLPEEQEEAMALGFDSSTWNFVDIGKETTCGNNSKSSDFANLIPEHKEAALALGFDSRTWHVRDWEGDRSFQYKKIKVDIPELLELDLDYLRTLKFKIQTTPEGKPGQDDETIPLIEMAMPEFVDGLREGKNLYMKYED
eukprot:scaffold191260_cov62-Attheya_sp.AAC.1